MVTGGVRGLVTGPEPAVIDEELCRHVPAAPYLLAHTIFLRAVTLNRKCIATVRTRPAQSGEVETKREATAFREVS